MIKKFLTIFALFMIAILVGCPDDSDDSSGGTIDDLLAKGGGTGGGTHSGTINVMIVEKINDTLTPVTGAMVQVIDSAAAEHTFTTLADGMAVFTGVPAGIVTVTALKSGYDNFSYAKFDYTNYVIEIEGYYSGSSNYSVEGTVSPIATGEYVQLFFDNFRSWIDEASWSDSDCDEYDSDYYMYLDEGKTVTIHAYLYNSDGKIINYVSRVVGPYSTYQTGIDLTFPTTAVTGLNYIEGEYTVPSTLPTWADFAEEIQFIYGANNEFEIYPYELTWDSVNSKWTFKMQVPPATAGKLMTSYIIGGYMDYPYGYASVGMTFTSGTADNTTATPAVITFTPVFISGTITGHTFDFDGGLYFRSTYSIGSCSLESGTTPAFRLITIASTALDMMIIDGYTEETGFVSSTGWAADSASETIAFPTLTANTFTTNIPAAFVLGDAGGEIMAGYADLEDWDDVFGAELTAVANTTNADFTAQLQTTYPAMYTKWILMAGFDDDVTYEESQIIKFASSYASIFGQTYELFNVPALTDLTTTTTTPTFTWTWTKLTNDPDIIVMEIEDNDYYDELKWTVVLPAGTTTFTAPAMPSGYSSYGFETSTEYYWRLMYLKSSLSQAGSFSKSSFNFDEDEMFNAADSTMWMAGSDEDYFTTN